MQWIDETADTTADRAAMDLCRLLHPSSGVARRVHLVTEDVDGGGGPGRERALAQLTRLEQIPGFVEALRRHARAQQ